MPQTRQSTVLSIGKIGGGQGDPRYYIDAVAKDHEDYYSGHGEAVGEWFGSGAQAQGLAGTVADDEFLGLLAPDPTAVRKVLAFDLTFSAPKSVSVLYGVGDDRVARATRNAHDAAVREAMDYLERHACWTRRGRSGREVIRGDGLTVAAFRHRTSRAGDPQLHTHAVVANRTKAKGVWTALDGRAIYAHARTAGFLYQAALRRELTIAVGVEWGPVHNGAAEIAGISEEVREHFSRRANEIYQRMRSLGLTSVRAAKLVGLETRRRKQYDIPADRLREEWRSRASEMGLGLDELAAVLDRCAPGPPTAPLAQDVAASLSAPGGITRDASTFDRRDVLRDWADAHREGASVARLEALADEWLASDAAIALEPGHRRPTTGPRYSTPEMLRLESRVIEEARGRRSDGSGVVSADEIRATIDRSVSLSPDQAALVESLTSSGHGVEVVRAAAGTGKTYALAVARDLWEASGARVYGCALAARAAVELQAQAGVDATTIARALQDIRHGYGLPPDSVLIVDEAGMVGTRAIAELADHAAETHSKLVLVGDDRQLPELDAGGAFRGLAERLGAVELRDVRRQAVDWDRAALHQLRRGKLEEWAEAYRAHGRLVARPTASDLREQLVSDWWHASAKDVDAVMIAHRRSDVADLNALARARMREDDRLIGDELEAGGASFAAGDRVLARKNDRRTGIVNGARGEVVGVDTRQGSLTARLEDGQTVTLDASYLDAGNLTHGYALTAHAAQGATVDRAFVLGSDDLYREWGYTALTRHREEARFYVVSPGSVERCLPGLDPDTNRVSQEVISMLGHSRRQELAVEVLERGFREVKVPEPNPSPPDEQSDGRALEAEAARLRAESLRAERSATLPWRRSRRRQLDELARANEQAAAQWADQVAPSASSAPEAPHQPRRSDGDDLRLLLLEPPTAVEERIGSFPHEWRDRERWAKAAIALTARPDLDVVPLAELPDPGPDVGIEL
jgi:conjugative relaxase-like TrwC/TraI family protein